MDIRRIKIIFMKDWKELRQSKQAMLPMLILPVIFVVVLPVILVFAATQAAADPRTAEMLKNMSKIGLPPDLNEQQAVIYMMLIFILAPFFLLIPVMNASIIAASSFAGEKERKTIEGLLYTPVTDKELVLGKVAVCVVPAVLIAWLSFVVYGVLVNAFAYPFFGRLIFPTTNWVTLIFWLTPGLSFLSLAMVVAVSQRAAGVWEAQQISALLLLPIIGVMISQVKGVLYLTVPVNLIAGAVIYVIDVFVYRWLVRTLNRERIVTKLV